MHALTAGAFGTMVLAVMTRVALAASILCPASSSQSTSISYSVAEQRRIFKGGEGVQERPYVTHFPFEHEDGG